MLQYFITNTSIPIDLLVLSDGKTVTGQSPYVMIRNKETGSYFDFATRTFTSVTISATALMVSALDGLYRYSWDTSALFYTPTNLMFEYHVNTAMAIDDVLFTRTPLSTANAAAVGGSLLIQSRWNKKEKERLFNKIDSLAKSVQDFKVKALVLLRKINKKEPLDKEDLEFLSGIQERDIAMWQEIKKILELDNGADTKEVLERLAKHATLEKEAKDAIVEMLKKKYEEPEVIKEDEDEDFN